MLIQLSVAATIRASSDLPATRLKSCRALANAVDPQPARTMWLATCAAARERWLEHMRPLTRSAAQPIRSERLAHELSDCLPEDAIVVADTGFSAIWTAQLTELCLPGQRYLRAAGSLGWAFPAAIGAACAVPGTPVVCFAGDGAVNYHLSELEPSVVGTLPIVLVINNNAALGQGLRSVKKLYAGREGSLADLVLFKDVDFAEVAKQFGIAGRRITDPADISPALKEAIASGEPTVIDVVSDPDCCPEPPWTP